MTEPTSTARTGWQAEPSDPDTADAPSPQAPPEVRRYEQATLLAAISAGGVLGAAARYGAGLLWPTAAGSFPWTTFWINVIGCGLMGILMVTVTEAFSAHRLVRPFLGTGILGGFTTFSTFSLDVAVLYERGEVAMAAFYVLVSVIVSIAALFAGMALVRSLT